MLLRGLGPWEVHTGEYFEGHRYSDMDWKEIKAPQFLLGSISGQS
jgi:hypothetical protein